MDVSKVIQSFYPEAKPFEDYRVAYFKDEWSITAWNMEVPQPSVDQIIGRWEEIKDQVKQEEEAHILEELAKPTILEEMAELKKTVTEQQKVIEMLIQDSLK